MINILWGKTTVAVGLSALALTAGVGIAAADQDYAPMVNTTCSYSQVMSALNAQDSEAAKQFAASPMTRSTLSEFLASPPDRRQDMADAIASFPANQQYLGLIAQVFYTCNNF